MLVAPLGELRGPGDSGRLHVEAWVPSSLPDLRRFKEREPNALQPLTCNISGVALRCLLAPFPSLLRCVISMMT